LAIAERAIPAINSINSINHKSTHTKPGRLIARLSGDTVAAERLIQQAKETYPGMPENWYCERVLDDLERDRQ
jgi:hypothetical protein